MNNYTPRAQQVLALASREARGMGHEFVGAEHLLIGICRLGDQAVAGKVLVKCFKLNLEDIAARVKNDLVIQLAHERAGVPYSPKLRAILRLSQKVAKEMEHSFLGTEHFLLALFKGGGNASAILKELKLTEGRLRKEIIVELKPLSQKTDPDQSFLKKTVSVK